MNNLQSVFRSFALHQRTIFNFLPLTGNYHNYSTASNSYLSVEDINPNVAIVKLNRHPVNSLNLDMIEQLSFSIKELERKKYKGFILTSVYYANRYQLEHAKRQDYLQKVHSVTVVQQGPRCALLATSLGRRRIMGIPSTFSSGLDMTEMIAFEENRLRAFWRSTQELWKTLYVTPLATVTAINGHAPAAGTMLALSCDLRIIIDSKATMGITGARLGIAVPQWFRSLFQSTIGFRQAEKALILGTLFAPQEALALNLVDDLASSSDDLYQKALHNIQLLINIPETARQITKIGMRKKLIEDLNAYGDKELEDFVEFLSQEQTQNMLKAHMEKLKFKKATT